MTPSARQQLSQPFRWGVTALGALVCAHALYRLTPDQLNFSYLVIVVLTLAFGSRVFVHLPGVSSQISVSDTFVFLTLLMFGGEPAILLAGADAVCTSRRTSKKKATICFNAAIFLCSTFLTVWTLRAVFGDLSELSRPDYYSSRSLVAVCVMGLTQYVANSGLAAVSVALKSGQPAWQTWRKNFLWTCVAYFAAASAAGLISKLIGLFGVYAFVATAPIIAVIYFTYCTYLKNVEASARQAELASAHALEVQQHLKALSASEERFRSAFDFATVGMAVVSLEGNWLQVNPALCEILGWPEGELLRRKYQDVAHPGDLVSLDAHVRGLVGGRVKSSQAEMRCRHRQGQEVYVHLGASLVRDDAGEPVHLIFQIQDITDRKRAEERLLHDALHDALTGLPNRALVMDHVKMAIQRSKRDAGRTYAVLFLDLDRFKVVNDSLGHMIGDQLLVGIARRLEACLRPGDTVARLGGDEFTILLEDIESREAAAEVAGRVQSAVSQPFTLSGHDVFTTASIGIALGHAGYDSAEDILRDADTAMYRAKVLGKKRHVVFDKAMHDRAVELLQLETDLRRALDRGEFFLHYQPIVSLDTGRATSFEALLRWQHPERGLIPPADFIPVAEETGMIIPLGQWVLEEACRQVRAWEDAGDDDAGGLAVSVNLSGRQFSQSDLVEQVSGALGRAGLAPARLKLEVTESMVMENVDVVVEVLTRLRALGVGLSIDDFGTGYSSLSYLHKFPIDTLKIDRSFVGRMTENVENAEIVRTIITLAKSLQMSVVAEGVETREQFARLTELGCDFGQGFVMSRPVGAGAAAAMIGADFKRVVAESDASGCALAA